MKEGRSPAHPQIVGSAAGWSFGTGKRLIKDVKKLPAAPFSMMTEKARRWRNCWNARAASECRKR